MSESHNGRVAVIMGAAGGLGKVFAQRLEQEGCRLALTDRIPCQEIVDATRGIGVEVRYEVCDLSSPAQIHSLAESFRAHVGVVDILINNAAILGFSLFHETDLSRFHEFQRVNLDAPFLLCKEVAPRMVERTYGRIVNVVSRSD